MQLKMRAFRRSILSLLLDNTPIRLTLLSLVVVSTHLIPFFTEEIPEKKPVIHKKPMTVRTVQLQPKQVRTVSKKTVPVQKKRVSKKPVQKKVKAQKKKAAKKTVAPTKLYSKLEKQIPALDSPKKPLSQKKPLSDTPHVISPKSLEENESSQHTDYLSTLMGIFSSSLELPEIGNVKGRLTLTTEGIFFDFEILESKSTKNSAYLQNNLPQLQYPQFNTGVKSKEQVSFVITFTNAQ